MSGLLFVLSEPGEQVSLDEYTDWYDNEHVPLRMDHLSSFLTGARFSASDGLTPTFLAVYDITSPAALAEPEYTKLRANRSPREADLVKRLAVLDRRTYAILVDSDTSGSPSGFAAANPVKAIVTAGLEVESDAAVETAATALFTGLRGIQGWSRSKIYALMDGSRAGVKVPEGPEGQNMPRYMVVHELSDPQIATTPEFEAASTLEAGRNAPGEYRSWKLYRAYPGIAQGNNPTQS